MMACFLAFSLKYAKFYDIVVVVFTFHPLFSLRKGNIHEPDKAVLQVCVAEYFRSDRHIVLYSGRHLFHRPGGGHRRRDPAEPLPAHVQPDLCLRLDDRSGCGHPVRHSAGAGRGAGAAVFFQRHPLRLPDRHSVHAGGRVLPGHAPAAHGRRCGHCGAGPELHPHLPAVHTLLHVQLYLLSLRPQRR